MADGQRTVRLGSICMPQFEQSAAGFAVETSNRSGCATRAVEALEVEVVVRGCVVVVDDQVAVQRQLVAGHFTGLTTLSLSTVQLPATTSVTDAQMLP